MLLNMDKKGRVYQAASHRSDGLGFEEIPVAVTETDVYLDNAGLNESREINETNKCLDASNLAEKIYSRDLEMRNEMIKKKYRKIKNYIDELNKNPDIQQVMLADGLEQNMSQSSDFNQLDISGYGMSKDGLLGPTGLDRATEMALRQQMGEIPTTTETAMVIDEPEIYEISKEEMNQYLLADEVAKQQEVDASQGAIDILSIEYLTSQLPVRASLPEEESELSNTQEYQTDQILSSSQPAVPNYQAPINQVVEQAVQSAKIPWKWIAIAIVGTYVTTKVLK